MSSLLKFSGLNWNDWQPNLGNDFGDETETPTTGHTNHIQKRNVTSIPINGNPTLSSSYSPITAENKLVSAPPTDDTMKLPSKDMNIFGLCPEKDDLILVTCDICQYCVKIEAFKSHIQTRHKKAYEAFKAQGESNVEKENLATAQSKVTCVKASTRIDPVIPKITKHTDAEIPKHSNNIHYTSNHPKPLAVCAYGGKRIGGLLVANRSKFLARKMVYNKCCQLYPLHISKTD